MKVLSYLFIAIAAVCLASCHSESTIKPTSVKINGPLSEYFEVVDRNYKLTDGKVNIEFKRIEEGGPESSSLNSNPTFTVELLDEDGNSISSSSTSVVWSREQLEAVFALGVDETASITFEFDDTKGAVNFKVSSKWNEDSESGAASSANDTLNAVNDTLSIGAESTASSSGSEDWDALLDSYDQYVTKYISFVKKAAKGDMSAVAEYPALMEKAEEYGNRLENAKSDLSAAQWARYMKITQKMASAASEM